MSDKKDREGNAAEGEARIPATKDARSTVPTDLRPGDSCGDYEIVEFVAAGGMGEVYKVKGKFGGMIAALKRVRRQLLERTDLLERFETEARILAQLKHRYIVRLLHAGKHEGNPYIVMEWLDGVTLRDFMNQRRKPVDLATGLLYAICIAKALCAAHAVRILHRDLKPENILMRKKGGLKVLDFGLGKLTEGDRVSTSERLGGMCTPHYSAPEQLERSGVDERTDVYALALIFMEMVTGRYAFADAPGVLPHRDIAQANQFLATPNSLRALLPKCPESLSLLVERALSKDKSDRPTSKEFLDALREERRKLDAQAAVEEPAIDDEDSVDEPGPPQDQQDQRPSEPSHETSLVRRLPKLKTDVLPDEFEPPDPTAAGNMPPTPPPPPPAQKTVKMSASAAASARGEEPSSATMSSATQNAWALTDPEGEVTSGGRSATLPPDPGMHTAPAVEPAPAPVHTPEAPRAMPTPTSTAPPPTLDTAAARASIEFANRPTTPWNRPAPERDGAVSLTPAPTHRGVRSLPGPEPGTRVPLWAGPVVGVAVALGVFGLMVAVRGHRQQSRGDATRASVSATSSAATVTTNSAAASADPPGVPAPAASAVSTASASVPAPMSAPPSAGTQAKPTPSAGGAQGGVSRGAGSPAPSATAPALVAASHAPPFVRPGSTAAPAATQPAPAPTPPPTATAAPTGSASPRVFGTDD
jgi:serine/threonine protein kinase